MTPAIDLLIKHKIHHALHEYEHDPATHAFGLEAAEKLQVNVNRVFKTILLSLDDKQLVVCVVPVDSQVNTKAVAKFLNKKKATLAEREDVERSTGYLVGGVSPIAQKRTLITLIDSSASEHPTIFVSGGRRGLEIEISPDDLITLVNGKSARISR